MNQQKHWLHDGVLLAMWLLKIRITILNVLVSLALSYVIMYFVMGLQVEQNILLVRSAEKHSYKK